MINFGDINERKKLLEELSSRENKDRKSESFSQYEVFNGRIGPYVKSYMKKFYSSKEVEKIPIISSINLCKRIIAQEASLYKNAPDRKFVGMSDDQIEVVQKVYNDMMFDAKMIRVNQFYKLQNQVHSQVAMKNGKLQIRPLLAHHLDAVPDMEWPENAEAYVISNFDKSEFPNLTGYADGVNQKIGDPDDWNIKSKFAIWSDEFNFIMDGNAKIISEDVKNELGLKPIIDIYNAKDFVYWVTQGQSDADFTVQFNAAVSDLAQVMRLQGFSIAYLISEEGMIPNDLMIGPNYLLTLPVNPNSQVRPQFGYAQPNADLKGGIDYLESFLSTYLSSRGLNPSLISTQGKSEHYSSGLDRLLAQISKFEASKSDIETFINAEQDIFKIIIRYLNVYSGTDLLNYKVKEINENEAAVEIKFKEPDLIKTDSEKLSLIERRMDLGLISRVEAVMEDRALSKEAALEVLKEIDSEIGPEAQDLANELMNNQ